MMSDNCSWRGSSSCSQRNQATLLKEARDRLASTLAARVAAHRAIIPACSSAWPAQDAANNLTLAELSRIRARP